MALEDRIRTSIDDALAQLAARLDQQVRDVLQPLTVVAIEERDAAAEAARRAAREEALADVQRQIEDVEARARARLDNAIVQARADERERAAAETRALVEAEADERLRAALEEAAALAADRHAAESAQPIAAPDIVLGRLLESIRGLDGATTLSEVLDALARAAARETARAAVLVQRQDRLAGWKLSGFGARDLQPKALDLGLNDGSIIGQAVGTSRTVATSGDHQPATRSPEFAALPGDARAIAVPVLVGGRVVAVVYADDAADDGAARDASWPEAIEILARHAGRCLEALTVQKAIASPPARFWVPGAARRPEDVTGLGSAPVAETARATPARVSADSPPGVTA